MINQDDSIIKEETAHRKPQIMVVDDEEYILEPIKIALEHNGYQVTTCLDGRKAIKELKKGFYDLVVTDLKMPNFSGTEFVKEAKAISPSSDLVVMTGFPSVDTAVECMKLGAVDYIAKPFDMEYFNIVVEKTLYKRELEKRASEREYYEHISRIDGLTGAYNHSFFYNLLGSEISRAVRYKHSFSILMIDIDDFKKFNDTYGHQTGDNILKTLASLLKSLVRRTDPVARYGGEEFAIILSETTKEHGIFFGNRIVNGVAASKFEGVPHDVSITISAGLAGFPGDANTQETLVKKADDALYQAKRTGKNILYVYGNEGPV